MEEQFTTLLIGIAAFLSGAFIAYFIQVGRSRREEEKRQSKYVSKEMYNESQSALKAKEERLQEYAAETARQVTEIDHLRERLQAEQQSIAQQQKQFQDRFENLANRIFDEKSRKMTEVNNVQIEGIIKPFKERIQEFEKKVEETYVRGTQERSVLKDQLGALMSANSRLSEEAVRLTQALRGDSQFQGSWGEIQLVRLLESAGLQEGIHFEAQGSLKDEDGNTLRPDILINLPDQKHLVLDSKVSLVAFEQYFHAESEDEERDALKQHITSINAHIKNLSGKNYQTLNGINPPDYVLLFMPLEQAFIAAVQEDPDLYERALKQNIAIVSPSTLLATLRTVAYIWKNENQKNNVMAIAREAGQLYDKFVGFIGNMEQLGKRMDSAREDYLKAMGQLSESPRRGGTIIGRIEKLREMGAETSKRIPQHLVEQID